MHFKGIDVSSWQGDIDWKRVKDDGVKFAVLRMGFGCDERKYDDSRFLKNAAECEKLAIPYGTYLYSYAAGTQSALSEARHALRLLEKRRPSLGVFYDLEESDIRSYGQAVVLSIAKTFVKELERHGYTAGVYASYDWFTSFLTNPYYDTIPKWVAQWGPVCTFSRHYDIWQNSSDGTVDGIRGKVDTDVAFFDIYASSRSRRLNGDANLDNRVDASDARSVLRASAGLESLSLRGRENADMDGDKKLTASDAREILRKI